MISKIYNQAKSCAADILDLDVVEFCKELWECRKDLVPSKLEDVRSFIGFIKI